MVFRSHQPLPGRWVSNGSGGRVLPAITLDVAGGNECLLFVEVAVVRLTSSSPENVRAASVLVRLQRLL